MDLFAAAEGVSSGEVPREIWPGIVWGDEAEKLFVDEVMEWTILFPKVALEPKMRKQVEDSARWAIELALLRSTIDREVEAAKRCYDAAEKRTLHTEWLRRYGAEMTATIVRSAKDPALRTPDLGRRL